MKRRALLVGYDEAGAAELCAGLQGAVDVAHARTAQDAWAKFANRPTHAVLISADLAESDLKQLCSLLRSSRGRTRIALIASRGAVPNGAGASLDLVVLRPITPRVVRVALGLDPTPAEKLDLPSLLEVSCLSGATEHIAESVAADLQRGFGVDRCDLVTLREGDHDDLATYCRASLCAGAPVLVAADSSNPSDDVAGYLAVRLDLPGRAEPVVLCLSVDGPRAFSREARSAFEAVARRFSVEWTWRSLFDRVVVDSDSLRESPRMDPELGVWNRAALLQLMSMQAAASERSGEPLSVAVLDVVGLGEINRTYGHSAGDAVIRSVALAIRATVRDEDIVGRFGGDEIGVIFFRTKLAEARRAVGRVLDAIAGLSVKLSGGTQLAVRTSCGIALRRGEQDRGQDVFERATGAAAAARARGKDLEVADSVTELVKGRSLSQSASRDDIAVTLGSYRLIHEISRGAMGVVYRAEDLGLRRPVAVKMLRPELADDPGFVARFQSEAAILATLHHPNLVSVYAFESDGDHTFFAMELVEGQSVDSALERCQHNGEYMALERVRDVATQIASALDAMHDKGIVHRDVKPGNIVLDPFRGRAVLVDVGLAGLHGDELVPAGTPGFIAPEIIAGKDSDSRSDVYSLAATVYTMLTMREPYGAGNMSTLLSRQLKDTPRLPSDIRPDIAAVDEALMKGLERYPRKRHDTAGELAAELARALDIATRPNVPSVGVEAPPPEAVRRAGPQTLVDLEAAMFTRGIVFRSIPRVLGVRTAERWRASLLRDNPELSELLAATTAPLSWQPAPLFCKLLAQSPSAGRGSAEFARELGRATIRASFRRFFPASAATLAPKRTLAALGTVWQRYHTWGVVSAKPMKSRQVAVEVDEGLADAAVCSWTRGMLEALVILSGGGEVLVEHRECRARGAGRCMFNVAWAELGSQPGVDPVTTESSRTKAPAPREDDPGHSLSRDSRLLHTDEQEPVALRSVEMRTEPQAHEPSRTEPSTSSTTEHQLGPASEHPPE